MTDIYCCEKCEALKKRGLLVRCICDKCKKEPKTSRLGHARKVITG